MSREHRMVDNVYWMALALVLVVMALSFCGCAGIPPRIPGSNNCGMVVAGSYPGKATPSTLTFDNLAEQLFVALDAIELSTDPRLYDRVEVCHTLVGYRVYTMPERTWPDPWGRTWSNGNIKNIGGYTDCVPKMIVVGTPPDGDWLKSSIIHEIFHAAQKCEASPPMSEGDIDELHAGWTRFGIDEAIKDAKNAYSKATR